MDLINELLISQGRMVLNFIPFRLGFDQVKNHFPQCEILEFLLHLFGNLDPQPFDPLDDGALATRIQHPLLDRSPRHRVDEYWNQKFIETNRNATKIQ